MTTNEARPAETVRDAAMALVVRSRLSLATEVIQLRRKLATPTPDKPVDLGADAAFSPTEQADSCKSEVNYGHERYRDRAQRENESSGFADSVIESEQIGKGSRRSGGSLSEVLKAITNEGGCDNGAALSNLGTDAERAKRVLRSYGTHFTDEQLAVAADAMEIYAAEADLAGFKRGEASADHVAFVGPDAERDAIAAALREAVRAGVTRGLMSIADAVADEVRPAETGDVLIDRIRARINPWQDKSTLKQDILSLIERATPNPASVDATIERVAAMADKAGLIAKYQGIAADASVKGDGVQRLFDAFAKDVRTLSATPTHPDQESGK